MIYYANGFKLLMYPHVVRKELYSELTGIAKKCQIPLVKKAQNNPEIIISASLQHHQSPSNIEKKLVRHFPHIATSSQS